MKIIILILKNKEVSCLAKIISVITQKGGVGKTTIVNALASTLTHSGCRVLVIDMDPQGNLSFSVGADTENTNTIYEMLKGEVNPLSAIQRMPMTDVIPANILLSGIELEFTGKNREYLLHKALDPLIKLYDYILIDSPPGLGILTINALTACDYVIIPLVPDVFALQGLTLVYDTIEHISQNINPKIAVAGVLMNRFSKYIKMHREIYGTAKMICDKLNINLFKTTIHECRAFAESHTMQNDITVHGEKTKATKDFSKFLKELESIFTVLEMRING